MATSRSFGATLLTTRSPIAICPREIFSRPAIILRRVDFPQPDGPTRVTNSQADAAKSFVKWATSKAYVQRVGETEGWVAAPPGTRKSTYASADYQKAAPFAATVLSAIESADPTKQTKDPVPYTGIQFVAIPEFQGIGTQVGQAVAAAVTGEQSVDDALNGVQAEVERTMTEAGYIK